MLEDIKKAGRVALHPRLDGRELEGVPPLGPAGDCRLQDLAVPPGNRLEKLKADRVGQWSIRVNDRFRVCFRWEEGAAEDVEIVDYH